MNSKSSITFISISRRITYDNVENQGIFWPILFNAENQQVAPYQLAVSSLSVNLHYATRDAIFVIKYVR